MDINSVVKKYIELRDQKAEIAERHKEELKPIMDSMGIIEDWLMKQMDSMGVDSLKTPSGTPYKAVTKSVKLADSEAFKKFVFSPVIEALDKLPNMPDILGLLQAGIRWDMIDFRAGKKGIVEYIEEGGVVPPGVTIDQFATVNIRRA